MSNKIDITGDRSLIVDYDYCTIHTFLAFASLPKNIELTFHDLVIRDSAKSCKIKGDCLIQFDSPCFVETELSLFDKSGKAFLTDVEGKSVKLSRQWGSMNQNLYTYNVGGICEWPRGDYSITITTGQNVNLLLPNDVQWKNTEPF